MKTRERLLQLTAMAHGGEALGRAEGKVIFVAGGIPGEEVLVQITEDRERYARARLVEVITPSPHRIEDPRCPHFGTCGGCQWQHIDYEAQLAFKRDVMRDQLARIGRLPDVIVRPTLGMADPWFYRNHVQFRPTPDGRPGFLGLDGRTVVPIERCYITATLLEDIYQDLDLSFPELERLSLRAGLATGERMLILETRADIPPAVTVDAPVSCVFLLGDGTSVILVGQSYITEEPRGRPFRISAGSFFQVNTTQTETLLDVVTDYLEPRGEEVLLDAYCGVGTFGLSLAEQVAAVIGIEESESAIADADFNAGELDNVTLIQGRVEDVLPALDEPEPVDVAILDPPRQGCAKEALDALVELRPGRIIYVSCDPATLARDLRQLVYHGYDVVEVQPVDMFPQTYHVESVTLLMGQTFQSADRTRGQDDGEDRPESAEQTEG